MSFYDSKFNLGPLTTNHKFGHVGFVRWREREKLFLKVVVRANLLLVNAFIS